MHPSIKRRYVFGLSVCACVRTKAFSDLFGVDSSFVHAYFFSIFVTDHSSAQMFVQDAHVRTHARTHRHTTRKRNVSGWTGA